jgi:hypothetical protein
MNSMNGIELAWTPRNYNNGPTYKSEGLDYKSLGEIVLRAIAAGKITPPKNTRRQCKETPLKLTVCMVCGVSFERETTSKRRTCGPVCYNVAIQRKHYELKRLPMVCGSCGGNFEARRPTAKFCSNLCSGRAAKKRRRARKQLKRSDLAGIKK